MGFRGWQYFYQLLPPGVEEVIIKAVTLYDDLFTCIFEHLDRGTNL